MDTIAAIATPPGRGAIAIVRCSGPDARRIAARVFHSQEPLVDRVATYGAIVDVGGTVIDRGLALAMDAPRTATGEDVVELHVHGSPIAARETLRALVHAGARIAGPGEFTRRAYLNGKLDLSAAEAVAALVDAESRAGAQAAAANLAGGLRREVERLHAQIAALLEELAGAIDYPDEVQAPEARDVRLRTGAIAAELNALIADWERGRFVREGIALAIVGPPNAGKSSLLNAFVGEERAIVSSHAGTTRDTIEETFAIDGVRVRAIDTAGLRESDDTVERIGIARTHAALESATLALVVLDGAAPLDAAAHAVLVQTRARPRVLFYNKRDLGTRGFDARASTEAEAINGSAFERETLEALRAAIARAGWEGETLDLARPHLASARQAEAVARAYEAIARAQATLAAEMPFDLLTGDLFAAAQSLAEITGGAATAALLDGIFARFCVGK